jgi:hypothetical protein
VREREREREKEVGVFGYVTKFFKIYVIKRILVDDVE